ncbi:DROUGHT RESPONSE GENE [Hibiscus trionum]|uniref:DROUGHT RESPONSE protein n=1 Tax=Hibiscus trionum TaxID=183268 RepID=A0A9W7M856_HIBTR|nr:DROUGHT RESPONSE GENE [Hibiscus trionum]
MIKTLNPYSSTAKTAEIMSRYRPIAPKPDVPANSMNESSGMSQKIRQSPYMWPQLQARPSRTRKRGRGALSSAAPLKRARANIPELSSPSFVTSPAKNPSLQGFSYGIPQLSVPNYGSMDSSSTLPASLVTLPLLPCPPSVPVPALDCMEPCGGEKLIDLNKLAEIPEEKDLLKQLQTPPTSSVRAPRPVRLRPVGSIISVACIKENTSLTPPMQVPKKPEEVEKEVESEALPAIVSDSNNKVRLANSAYKQMVGQPECPWLDSIGTCEGRVLGNSCKRICGEVLLHVPDLSLAVKSNEFSCWVKIEWGSEGKKKSSVNAFCDVMRSTCEAKDSLFTWKFHPYPQQGSISVRCSGPVYSCFTTNTC